MARKGTVRTRNTAFCSSLEGSRVEGEAGTSGFQEKPRRGRPPGPRLIAVSLWTHRAPPPEAPQVGPNSPDVTSRATLLFIYWVHLFVSLQVGAGPQPCRNLCLLS